MSYEVRLDEMVGKHVAEFQTELSLAAKAARLVSQIAMPYGYPVALYHPHHAVLMPRYTALEKHDHGKLSNDVPWVLGMEVVGNYVIGLYNPRRK